MRRITSLAFALTTSFVAAQGSGDYLNFETPQVKPITVARVAGHDYVLACNTPDGSVEIYDTVDMRLVARVPVGQEPVSVVWNAGLSRLFTANMLGDSVSVAHLSAASATAPLQVRFERTEYVGDEPMMIAFAPDNLTFFVTHNQRSALSWRFVATLAPVVPGFSERILLTNDLARPTQALKEPRTILWAGTTLFALGYRGGHSTTHDSDLWSLDFASFRWAALGGLGTLKSNMAVAQNGDLWIVGGEALNDRKGVRAVAAAPTGFVVSLLHRVENAGKVRATIRTRDLNADALGKPVQRSRSLAHPLDVALFEKSGRVQKVFVAAFHSDRVGAIEPNDPDPAKWTVRATDVTVAKGSDNPMAGPRGLAIKYANSSLARDPGDRLYALNQLDNSIAVLDPASEKVLEVVKLGNDPTPREVRHARRFLYSAKLSGNGFISCASCHLDGKLDGLAWDLSDDASTKAIPINPNVIEGITDSGIRGMKTFPKPKGPMVTQSLQGLAASQTTDQVQFLFTTAPLHWRGDTSFQLFNGTFVKLQGMRNLAGANEPARGIPVADMRRLEVMVNSIHYPPNPDQPVTRTYSGSLGDPDKTDGSGGLRGLKLFHTEPVADASGKDNPVLAGRSCVQCHWLPDGSNNRLSRFGLATAQPMETAELRGLAQREAVVQLDANTAGTIRTGEFGLAHSGAPLSIVDFNQKVFGNEFKGDRKEQLDAISQFCREFDTGVAPLVGVAFTVDLSNRNAFGTGYLLGLFERQAGLANVGVAVQGVLAGKARGFWWRPDPAGGRWVEEPGSATRSRAELLLLLQGSADRLVFQATPLGSARRIAAPSGRAQIRRGVAPSEIEIEGLAPSTAWQPVQKLRKNWKPGPRSDPMAFTWSGLYSGTTTPVPEPPFMRTVRLIQYGMIQDGPNLGLDKLRHGAPLRFRVSGKDIRPGARLRVYVPNDQTAPPPYKTFHEMIPLDVPVYPTSERGKGGNQVWESAVEAAPYFAYVFCLGGPYAPGIPYSVWNRHTEPPAKGSFKPDVWNKHFIWVVNEDGTYATGGWQPLGLK